MKKIVYTACAKGVFNSSRGYQIYTCSNTYSEEERDVIVHEYIEGAKEYVRTAESPTRNIYTKDDKLGYLYLQAKPSGIDYSSGRSGNVLWQVLSDCGDASVVPMEIIYNKSWFEEAIDPAKLRGEVEPAFLSEYAALPAVTPAWKQVDAYFEAGGAKKEQICNLMDAMVDCLCNNKQLIVCAGDNENLNDLLRSAMMCLPSCIAQKITFDTYAYVPKKSKEMVLGVYNETEYYSNDFLDTEKYVLMDFKNNVSTYAESNSFYKKYLRALKGNFSMIFGHISALCNQEMAAISEDVNYRDFLNAMASIFYFLSFDASRLFVAGAEATREKVLEAGLFVQRYHSPELMEKVIRRMRELLSKSGNPKFFAELKSIISGNKELYKRYKPQIEAILYESVYNVLKNNGIDETVDFYQKLEPGMSESERVECVEQILKLLFNMTPALSKFDVAKQDTIQLVLAWLLKHKDYAMPAVPWVVEYFKKNLSLQTFEFLMNILCGDFRKNNKDAFNGIYQKLIEIIATDFIDDVPYLEAIVSWNGVLEPNTKKAEKKDFIWTKYTAEWYLYSIGTHNKLSLAQKRELAKRIFTHFSAWDATFLFVELEKLGPEISDYIAMPFVESSYQQHKDSLYIAYNEIPKVKGLLAKLFKYVIKQGQAAYACVELAKSDYASALKPEYICEALSGGQQPNLSAAERIEKLDDNINELISLLSKAKKEDFDKLLKIFTEGMYYMLKNKPSDMVNTPAVLSFYKKFEEKICDMNLPEATLIVLFTTKTSLLLNEKARAKKIETGIEDLAKDIATDIDTAQMRILEQRGRVLEPLLQYWAKNNKISLSQQSIQLLCSKFNINMREFSS